MRALRNTEYRFLFTRSEPCLGWIQAIIWDIVSSTAILGPALGLRPSISAIGVKNLLLWQLINLTSNAAKMIQKNKSVTILFLYCLQMNKISVGSKQLT